MNGRRLLLFAIFLFSGILGVLFLPKYTSINFKYSFLAGMFLGSLLMVVLMKIFPRLRQFFSIKMSEEDKKRLAERRELVISHPARIPIFIMAILFFGFAAFTLIFKPALPDWVVFTFLVIVFFLFGLSGFITLLLGESVDNYGNRHKGFWAYLTGAIFMALGWGMALMLLYFSFTKK